MNEIVSSLFNGVADQLEVLAAARRDARSVIEGFGPNVAVQGLGPTERNHWISAADLSLSKNGPVRIRPVDNLKNIIEVDTPEGTFKFPLYFATEVDEYYTVHADRRPSACECGQGNLFSETSNEPPSVSECARYGLSIRKETENGTQFEFHLVFGGDPESRFRKDSVVKWHHRYIVRAGAPQTDADKENVFASEFTPDEAE